MIDEEVKKKMLTSRLSNWHINEEISENFLNGRWVRVDSRSGINQKKKH